jgi:hypothetical protein
VGAFFSHEVLLSENAAPWNFMSAPIRCLLGSISGMGQTEINRPTSRTTALPLIAEVLCNRGNVGQGPIGDTLFAF